MSTTTFVNFCIDLDQSVMIFGFQN